jgi:hypothetical protein
MMMSLRSTRHQIACALALVAILSVLAVFFFPTIEGPYSAVNGPVTALLSVRAAAGLRTAIVHAGLSGLPLWFSLCITIFFGLLSEAMEVAAEELRTCRSSVLRC